MSSSVFSAIGAVLDYETVTVKMNYSTYVKRAYSRSLLSLCTPLQLQWLSDSCSKAYQKWIKKHGQSEGMRVKTDVLDEDGGKLHWIGKEEAQKVILYLHGDGFITPLNEDHITFMNHVRLKVKQNAKMDVKVAFLEYTLIPSAHFPTQLKQAVQAVRHLLRSNISPSNILLAGDSSGGLLLFQLLSHLLHPHPLIEPITIPPVMTRSQFAGILAISPWICPDEDYVDKQKVIGFHNYGIIDFVPAKVVNEWSSLMRREQQRGDPAVPSFKLEGGRGEEAAAASPKHNWQQPYDAPAEWWHDTYKFTSHILITHGTNELMAEDIEHFGEELDRAFRGTKAGVKVLSEMDGIHCGPLLATLMDTHGAEFMKNIVEWVSDQFAKTRQV